MYGHKFLIFYYPLCTFMSEIGRRVQLFVKMDECYGNN